MAGESEAEVEGEGKEELGSITHYQLPIIHYGSVKADPPLACPLLPLKKGGTRNYSKSPDYPGDLGGSPGHKHH